MRCVCAWCGEDMGDRTGPAGEVTHGICPVCLVRYYPDSAAAARGLLEAQEEAKNDDGREPALPYVAVLALAVFLCLVIAEARGWKP